MKGFRHEELEMSQYKGYVHGSVKYLVVELDCEVEQEHELSGRRVNKNKITYPQYFEYICYYLNMNSNVIIFVYQLKV